MDGRSPSGTSDGRRQNVQNNPQNPSGKTRDYHELIRRVCNLLLTSKTDYKVRAEIAAELKVLVEENVKSKRTFLTVRTFLNKLQVKLQLASQDRMMTPVYAVSMRELSDECHRVMEQIALFGRDHGAIDEPASAAASSKAQENELKTLLKSERDKNAALEKQLKDVQTSHHTEILKLADLTQELEEERNKKLTLTSRLYSELNDRNVEIRKLRSRLEQFQPLAGPAPTTATADAATIQQTATAALKQQPGETSDKNYNISDSYEKEKARLTLLNLELASKIEFLEEQVGNYQSQASHESMATGRTISELERKLAQKDEALLAAESKISELRSCLRRSNRVWETNRDTASCSWTNPVPAAPQYPESRQSAQHELDQLHAEIQDKQDEIELLQAQLESCQLALQDCESKFNVQEEGACELTADNMKFKTEIDQLHVALITKSRECYELQIALTQANEALRTLSSPQNNTNNN